MSASRRSAEAFDGEDFIAHFFCRRQIQEQFLSLCEQQYGSAELQELFAVDLPPFGHHICQPQFSDN
jgi:hypothetical protein